MFTLGSVFIRQATSVRVRDLSRPLGPAVQSDDTPQVALETLEHTARISGYDPMERRSIVLDGQAVLGTVSFFDITTSEAASVGDFATAIRVNDIVSGDLDALTAVPLLASRGGHPYYVLDGNKLVGTIEYSDLFGSAFRLCLFALTLQLEECALRCLLTRSTDAVGKLSVSRKELARGVCVVRFGPHSSETVSNLLRGTTFIDKSTMLSKLKLIPAMSGSRLRSVFLKAEQLRNYCAHPSVDFVRTSPIIAQDKFHLFLDDCSSVISSLEAIVQQQTAPPQTLQSQLARID